MATHHRRLEPRDPDGAPAPPVNLAAWHERFTSALTLPTLLAHFLANDLGLATADDPPAQAGIWLNAPRAMTELVDIEKLTVVKGSAQSNQFMGWALADPGGKTAAATTVDFLTQLCDHTLHLDGYESLLADLVPSTSVP
jgi:hypothetical protein